MFIFFFFFFSSRRRHTRLQGDWSSDVCSSDLLTRTGLRQVTAFIARMSSSDLAELDGVGPGRAHQVLAGAVVAAATLEALDVDELELCPWALREGVILRRLDQLPPGSAPKP